MKNQTAKDSKSEYKMQKYEERWKNPQSPKLKTGRKYLQYKTKGWHKILSNQ